jgi:hypothetical protein
MLTIDKYTKMVAPLDVRDLDLPNAFHTRLDADVLRCLRYMHDIELHTICYLRDLLVTSAHRDPEITTFLTGASKSTGTARRSQRCCVPMASRLVRLG